jgi:hypothetical protein
VSRIVPYNRYLRGVCALVGIPSDEIPSDVAATLNQNFNTAMKGMWNEAQWLPDICPYGEARIVGNVLTYPNNLAQTAYWTATALTATGNNMSNPADGRVTATRLLETVANSAHKMVQSSISFLPGVSYLAEAYIRPNGRTWTQLSVYDGDTTHSAFFQLTSTGTVGTTVNATTTNIGVQPNGFYLVQMAFTSSDSATSAGTYTVSASTDGSTLSYAGDITKGLYSWGVQLQQTSQVPQTAAILEWDQTGETEIDSIFFVWKTNPVATSYPIEQGYEIVPAGVQLINGTFWNYYVNGVNQNTTYGLATANPVWINYRKVMPYYYGDTYDATASYAVDEQVYFVNSSDEGDFYKCIAAASAGDTPETDPDKWELLPIYDAFLQYAIYQSYGDWLISDGQMDKAQAAYAVARSKMDTEADKMERQQGQVMPTRISTHLTSRSAW